MKPRQIVSMPPPPGTTGRRRWSEAETKRLAAHLFWLNMKER